MSKTAERDYLEEPSTRSCSLNRTWCCLRPMSALHPGTNYIFIIGVPADSRLAPFRASCGTPVPEAAGPAVFGHPSIWLECPSGGGMHSGHTMLRWSDGSVFYVISLHGYGALNRQIAQTLANALDLVSPP